MTVTHVDPSEYLWKEVAEEVGCIRCMKFQFVLLEIAYSVTTDSSEQILRNLTNRQAIPSYAYRHYYISFVVAPKSLPRSIPIGTSLAKHRQAFIGAGVTT